MDRFLHHPGTEVVLLALILASVAGTVAEVLVSPVWAGRIGLLDDAVAVVFAVELTARWAVARKKRRFFERYWVDLLSLAPFWAFRVLRVLRLFRAFVLVRRHVSPFRRGALSGHAEPLSLVVGSLVLILLATLVLKRVEGPDSEFSDIEGALWFSTYSLVGGEPIGGMPVTHVGRWTLLILMLGGMTVFGVFVGTVSAAMATGLRDRLDLRELDMDELEGHVVVCGWNATALTVLAELFHPTHPTDRAVVVVTEVELPDDELRGALPRDRLYRHRGDYTRVDVLEAVGVTRASSVILLADRLVARSSQDCDARTVLAALTIERMAPGIYTVAELHSRDNEGLLRMAGVEDVVVPDLFSGLILGSVQRNRGLVRLLDEVLTQTWGNAFHSYPLPARLVGRTVAAVTAALQADHRALLVAVEIDGAVEVNPPADRIVVDGSRLIVLHGDDFRPL
ncbi:MAG: NAD-binding protein [Myxococcota bacterium]